MNELINEFTKLNVSSALIKALEENKITVPTEIQEKTIPLVIAGKDVVAQSATGSGKTIAFAAGMVDTVKRGGGIQALILCPTRELADQVRREIAKFSRHNRPTVLAIYGGVGIQPQIDELPRADIVVGTPGRILDHMDRRTINFSRVKIVVLDEADRMFEMGFIDDVKKILAACPKERQSLLFSATINDDVYEIAKRHMHDPTRISATPQVDPSKLRQAYYDVPNNMKFSLLVHLMKQEKAGLVMIFCNTQRFTDFVAKNLIKAGVSAVAIHGGMTQAKRNHIMQQFSKNQVYALVCTDVAARGLDIKGVSHVYNYDIPKDSKQYVHRIGRTARAGEEGIAINLLTDRDHENFDRVLRDNSLAIERVEMPFIKKVAIIQQQTSNRRPPQRKYYNLCF